MKKVAAKAEYGAPKLGGLTASAVANARPTA